MKNKNDGIEKNKNLVCVFVINAVSFFFDSTERFKHNFSYERLTSRGVSKFSHI